MCRTPNFLDRGLIWILWRFHDPMRLHTSKKCTCYFLEGWVICEIDKIQTISPSRLHSWMKRDILQKSLIGAIASLLYNILNAQCLTIFWTRIPRKFSSSHPCNYFKTAHWRTTYYMNSERDFYNFLFRDPISPDHAVIPSFFILSQSWAVLKWWNC